MLLLASIGAAGRLCLIGFRSGNCRGIERSENRAQYFDEMTCVELIRQSVVDEDVAEIRFLRHELESSA